MEKALAMAKEVMEIHSEVTERRRTSYVSSRSPAISRKAVEMGRSSA